MLRVGLTRNQGDVTLMASKLDYLDTFGFEPGRRLARKYIVGELLGRGWEGEVYHVTEEATGVERAAKFFLPYRNLQNRAVKFYARKLDRLRDCSMLIQYHTQETFWFHGERITFLVSEYVNGELLSEFLKRQPGKRLQPFEALHLLRTLAAGVDEIHRRGEYHGDLHTENVIVNKVGLGYRMKFVDMYNWGRRTNEHVQDDLCDLIQIFHEALGGQRHYAKHPAEIKAICRGLKRSLIVERFRTVSRLCDYLDTMAWE
jgi:serine/threonine protein kinase